MLKQIEITVSCSADICLPDSEPYKTNKRSAFLCLKEVYEGEGFEEIGKKRLDYLSKITEVYVNNEIKKIKGGVVIKPIMEQKVEETNLLNSTSNSPFNNIK